MAAPALQVFAGPRARAHLRAHGLAPQDVAAVPGAAGGAKGIVLNPLDRWLFGHWLAGTTHTLHFLGASIGAWRLACACLPDAAAQLALLAEDYITQRYEREPGRSPTAATVSRTFRAKLDERLGLRAAEVLSHPQRRLHVFTSRGRHLLGREGRLRTPVGYLGAFLANAASRRALGAWLERVVFSDPRDPLPLPLDDFPSTQTVLTPENLSPAILASCSIPFWLQAVHDVPGGPRGAYWDGGITDYHLHLNYAGMRPGARAEEPRPGESPGVASSAGAHAGVRAAEGASTGAGTGVGPVAGSFGPGVGTGAGLVLYPHFQPHIVPGWLDKGLRSRHGVSPFLDNVVVLAPNPDWIRTLPNARLPDRGDFKRYSEDEAGRQAAWRRALAESERLAEDFARLVEGGRAVDALPLP
jgi:hypothetical protein